MNAQQKTSLVTDFIDAQINKVPSSIELEKKPKPQKLPDLKFRCKDVSFSMGDDGWVNVLLQRVEDESITENEDELIHFLDLEAIAANAVSEFKDQLEEERTKHHRYL